MLGAFTMTNTKLLLTSKIGQPYDPVSDSGVVGKNFCYQVGGGINLFMKDKWFNPFLATGSTQVYMDEFNNDNFDHAGLGFLGGGGINAAMFNGRPIGARRVPPGTPRWGSAWKKANADWYAHSMGIGMQGSCYPHRQNYLDLDPTYTDAYGQALIRMNFDWRDNELKMSKYIAVKQTEIAKAFGADIVSAATTLQTPFDTRVYQSTHITGGTIMGKDPGTSVVSPHLQHWDAQNLFVVGASVFAHNSGYNPTGPLAALALRVGDDMASGMSSAPACSVKLSLALNESGSYDTSTRRSRISFPGHRSRHRGRAGAGRGRRQGRVRAMRCLPFDRRQQRRRPEPAGRLRAQGRQLRRLSLQPGDEDHRLPLGRIPPRRLSGQSADGDPRQCDAIFRRARCEGARRSRRLSADAEVASRRHPPWAGSLARPDPPARPRSVLEERQQIAS